MGRNNIFFHSLNFFVACTIWALTIIVVATPGKALA